MALLARLDALPQVDDVLLELVEAADDTAPGQDVPEPGHAQEQDDGRQGRQGDEQGRVQVHGRDSLRRMGCVQGGPENTP